MGISHEGSPHSSEWEELDFIYIIGGVEEEVADICVGCFLGRGERWGGGFLKDIQLNNLRKSPRFWRRHTCWFLWRVTEAKTVGVWGYASYIFWQRIWWRLFRICNMIWLLVLNPSFKPGAIIRLILMSYFSDSPSSIRLHHPWAHSESIVFKKGISINPQWISTLYAWLERQQPLRRHPWGWGWIGPLLHHDQVWFVFDIYI